MEFLNKSIVFAIAFSFISACTKSGPECFQSPGKTVKETRELGDFHVLKMYDNVDVVLVQSNINKVDVIAGERVIDALITKVDKGHLYINNKAQYRFLRQSERINRVVVYYRKLDTIVYQSLGKLSTMDERGESTWSNSDSLMLDLVEGAGDSIHLRLATPKARIVYRFGTVPIRIKGHANVVYYYYNGRGKLDAWDLSSDNVYLETRSLNDLLVKANLVLEATIKDQGNVYYHGSVPDGAVKSKLLGGGRIERRHSRP